MFGITNQRYPAASDHRSALEGTDEQTEGARFFPTLEWLEIYWKHFGAGRTAGSDCFGCGSAGGNPAVTWD